MFVDFGPGYRSHTSRSAGAPQLQDLSRNSAEQTAIEITGHQVKLQGGQRGCH